MSTGLDCTNGNEHINSIANINPRLPELIVNIHTIPSDTFPKQDVGSVFGIMRRIERVPEGFGARRRATSGRAAGGM